MEVHLGLGEGNGRAALGHLPEERPLGRRQLLHGVGDEHDGAGSVEGGERGRPVERAEAAGTRQVDQLQPAPQRLGGDAHLDEQGPAVAELAGLGDPAGDVARVDRVASGRPVARPPP